ncbi:hypothetical protein D3C77_692060 [compost metagenome]
MDRAQVVLLVYLVQSGVVVAQGQAGQHRIVAAEEEELVGLRRAIEAAIGRADGDLLVVGGIALVQPVQVAGMQAQAL